MDEPQKPLVTERDQIRGVGTAMLVAVLLALAGVLDIIFGIAAIANSHFYAGDTHYVFSGQHTWGWITLILGVVLLTAALSLFAGGTYGRVVGLIAAFIVAIGALMNTGGAHPWWSIGIFVICTICIYKLSIFGE